MFGCTVYTAYNLQMWPCVTRYNLKDHRLETHGTCNTIRQTKYINCTSNIDCEMSNALQYSARLPLVLCVVLHARTDLAHMCVDVEGWIKSTPIILILQHTLKKTSLLFKTRDNKTLIDNAYQNWCDTLTVLTTALIWHKICIWFAC